MIEVLARRWWALVLRGVAAVLFGVAALVWPGLALTALVYLFGAYAIVDGVFAIAAALSPAGRQVNRWLLGLEGVVSVIAGIIAFVWPGITALALLYIIAAWAIVTGVLEVIAAFRLRQEIQGEWLMGLGGVASVIFGLLLVIFPGSGALAVVWLIGVYAIVFGVVLVVLGLRLRSWHERAGVTHPV